MNKNIYLTGFMGTGKSTVGHLLAKKLGRKFIDTDQAIVKEQGMQIAEIFSQEGEDYFRTLESDLIAKLGKQNSLIVSLGGGAVMDPKNQAIIKQGLWVFILTPFELLQERALETKKRPLAQDTEKFAELYKQRLPVYQKAELIVDAGSEPADFVCQEIIKKRILAHEKT